MDTRGPRTRLRRPTFSQMLMILLALFIFAAGAAVSTAQPAQEGAAGGNTQRPPGVPGPFGEDIEKEFNDDDLKVKKEKPRGRWGSGLQFDKNQLDDPSVPVAVGAIQSLSGAGRHQGVIKIKRVEIKNRSLKIVNSVQLRWAIAGFDDPTQILSEGTTQLVNIWVEANNSQVIEIPTLYPTLLFKALAKDGELNGRFRLTIGLQEARFADGSFWRRQEHVAFLKSVYLDRSLNSQFPEIASTVLGTAPPLSGLPNYRTNTTA